MKTIRSSSPALIFLVISTAGHATGRAEPALLENACLRVAVDAKTAAISRVAYKQAIQFPFIADKGAGIAASGALFVPRVEIGGAALVFSEIRLEAGGRETLDFSGSFSGEPALKWKRRIRLNPNAAEFSIEDELRNDSDRACAVRLGVVSRQRAETWRLTDRDWIGSEGECRELPIAATEPAPEPVAVNGRRLFWRQIEQYGTGLLVRTDCSGHRARLSAEALPEKGNPALIAWRSEAIDLPVRARIATASIVSIDEGGGAPDQNNAFAPVLVRSDFARAGRVGQPITGFATVVSPVKRRLRVTVAADRKLAEADLDLTPGKVARIPVTFIPAGGGRLAIRTTAAQNGTEVGRAVGFALIDGDPGDPTWRTYSRKMPEENYRGSWEEIGQELVRDHARLIGPNSIEITVAQAPAADNGLSFYRRRLPYYARLLTGIARAMAAPPSRLFLTERDDPKTAGACMDVAFYGPDGPINAFSKERTGTSFGGLGYVKVIPTDGYRFHIYMHYGINSEGLSISGATLNEDSATAAGGRKQVEEWTRSGKPGIPPRVGIWMLLASCRTVDQALAMMQDRDAPILMGSSDMLLLDRAGHAACVESAGIDYHVYRHGERIAGFYVSGNYPHELPDGRFKLGSDWGWAANTMLREAFLRDHPGPRQGHLSLPDVISLMQSHEAGGMCQHIYDNPGELYTSCSFIAVTRTGDLWLSEGPPCETGYVRHTLADE